MNNFENEEFYRQHPEVSRMYRNGRLKQLLYEVRCWKEEGRTKEEILSIIDRKVLVDEDVEKIFAEDNDNFLEEKQNDVATEDINIKEDEQVNFEVEEEKELETKKENENTENEVEIKESTTEKILEHSSDNELIEYENQEFEDTKENEIVEHEEKIKEDTNEEKLEYLSDDELIDYEEQPFINNDEEDNEQLCNSIKLNGIIHPIIVRPYNGKYQILSGHRRRMCGRKVGLKLFLCLIKRRTDDEAALFLVDTNLCTRKNLKPTEIAKAFKLRNKALKNMKRNNELCKGIREIISEENGFSMGNVQRYMRINHLIEDLQMAVDNGKLPLKTAEQISFLGKKEQNMIKSLVCDENKKISEAQAKKLKRVYQDENEKLSGNRLRELLELDIKKDKFLTLQFYEEEVNFLFGGKFDKVIAKDIILDKFGYERGNKATENSE